MSKMVIPDSYQHISLACHPGMSCILRQCGTENGVGRNRGFRANQITRIDIFNINFHLFFFKVGTDSLFEIDTDISITHITGSILIIILEKILTGTFSNHNQCMLAIQNAFS